MAKKRYRCNNCRPPRDFIADKPACEVCNIDATKNPRFGMIVFPIVTVHFNPPTAIFGVGEGHAACSPNTQGFPGGYATHVASHVNCERCKATEAWKKAEAEEEEGPIMAGEDELLVPEKT